MLTRSSLKNRVGLSVDEAHPVTIEAQPVTIVANPEKQAGEEFDKMLKNASQVYLTGITA
ncbi:hypothetical protein CCZ37_17655 [Vibrio qinghaiensis]|uniref:Uncharacterized protein n=1 Tax=Vibrio qinghaiensis TaxID=2025808 RepID=A0A223N3N3_9VIBR|nr:hypothetical protein [Vibrio qinghaiensis]ASU24273.1 hypothetical protein CCZ37_17655 [Vibrio qinghaiensis]